MSSTPSSPVRSSRRLSLVIILAGLVADPDDADRAGPGVAPPQVSVTAIYTGANAQQVETAVTTPLEQAINGVAGHALHDLLEHQQRCRADHRHVRRDARSRTLPQVDVQNRVNQTLGRLPARSARSASRSRRGRPGFVMRGRRPAEKAAVRLPSSLSNYLDVYVKDALKRIPASATSSCSASARFDASLAGSRPAGRAPDLPPATSTTRCASRTCRSRPGVLARNRGDRADVRARSVRVEGRLRGRRSSTTSSSRRRRWHPRAAETSGGAELGAETYASAAPPPGRGRGRVRRRSSARGQRTDVAHDVRPVNGSARSARSPRGMKLPDRRPTR